MNNFIESINNAYGSKKEFERELIYKAYSIGNKGKIHFKIDKLFNFIVSDEPRNENEYTLLTCNLNVCDIFNFIDDLDYSKLSNAYNEALLLIKSK